MINIKLLRDIRSWVQYRSTSTWCTKVTSCTAKRSKIFGMRLLCLVRDLVEFRFLQCNARRLSQLKSFGFLHSLSPHDIERFTIQETNLKKKKKNFLPVTTLIYFVNLLIIRSDEFRRAFHPLQFWSCSAVH